jgi:hypothetical protein
MKTTKKQLKQIAKVEKKVSKVCDTKEGGVVFDEVTGIPYVESEIKPKKTTEVTRNDDGVIINKKTGKPHFEEILLEKDADGTIFNKNTGEPYNDLTALLKSLTEQKEKINKVLLPILKEKLSREISIVLKFGKTEPHLGVQLKEQGFNKLSENYIAQSELIRQDILALNGIDILSRKQTFKCFEKLSKVISRKVVDSEKSESEFVKHKKTIREKK